MRKQNEITPEVFMKANSITSYEDAITLCSSHMAGFATQRGTMFGIEVDSDDNAVTYQRLKDLMKRLIEEKRRKERNQSFEFLFYISITCGVFAVGVLKIYHEVFLWVGLAAYSAFLRWFRK